MLLPLQRSSEDIFEPGYLAEPPLVRFVAYARQQRLSGWVHLQADRLTDLLNAHDELLLAEVEVESLLDGTTRTAAALVVERRDLVAVYASGPRGDEARRRPSRTHPVAVQSANFLIGGLLHAPVGVDPLADFRGRPPMVPLSDAWIEFWLDGRRRFDLGTGTLIVNRERADAVWEVTVNDLADGLLHPPLLHESARAG
jgi:hypothetical protein